MTTRKHTNPPLYTNKIHYSKILEEIFSEVCFIRKEELKTEKKIINEIKIRGLYEKNNLDSNSIKDELFDDLVTLKDNHSKTKKDLYEQLINLKIPNKTLNINMFFNDFVKTNKRAKGCQDEFWSSRDQNRTYYNLKNYLRKGKERYEKLQNNKAIRTKNRKGIIQLKPLKGGKSTKKTMKLSKKVKRKINTGKKRR